MFLGPVPPSPRTECAHVPEQLADPLASDAGCQLAEWGGTAARSWQTHWLLMVCVVLAEWGGTRGLFI